MARRLLILLSAAMMLIMAAAGPARARNTVAQKAESAFEPVAFTDAFGRKIFIQKPLEKIAIGHHFFAEYLVGIGAGDLVAMVIPEITRDPVLFPELSRKPATGPLHESPDYESIIASGARAYLINGLYSNEGSYHRAVEKLEPAVKVIGLLNTTTKDVYATVSMIGKITRHEAGAAAYNKFQQDVLEMVRARISPIAPKDRVRIYFEPMRAGWTVNNQCMGFGYQIPLAGDINIAGTDLRHEFEWFETDKEWLAMQNPRVVLVRTPPPHGQGYGKKHDDAMERHVLQTLARPELSRSDAVKNGRVHSISWDLIRTPRMFIGIAYMAKLFYPELFVDMDPHALHQKYLLEFMRIDWDLSKSGPFIYPMNGSGENHGRMEK
jgi:iron complex transport system substrate-binding protein